MIRLASIFWLKDKSLEDSENLPDPDVLAQEIIDDLETALEQIQAIAGDMSYLPCNKLDMATTNTH